jgi:hypothetical protein
LALTFANPTPTQASGGENWALRAKAVMDRMRTALGDLGGACMGKLQGTAEALGGRLGVDGGVVSVFSEEVGWGKGLGPIRGRDLSVAVGRGAVLTRRLLKAMVRAGRAALSASRLAWVVEVL